MYVLLFKLAGDTNLAIVYIRCVVMHDSFDDKNQRLNIIDDGKPT